MSRAASSAALLPRSGPEREALRERGQFWTPDWVADAMAAYVLIDRPAAVLDPAVGAGAFFRAVRRVASKLGTAPTLVGFETDPRALEDAARAGTSGMDLSHVRQGDFLRAPVGDALDAVVANPPYIRHHRLPRSLKDWLRSYGARTLGHPLDGRAGIHVYFLIRALTLLAPGGRLAFILPADTCEGVFAADLWGWIACRFRIEGVVTFAPDATPFPGVDTNPVVLLIRNNPPAAELGWARCLQAGGGSLLEWVRTGFQSRGREGLEARTRLLAEALGEGFSRPPSDGTPTAHRLRDFASVMRGIATGANDFFYLTVAQAKELRIPRQFLLPAIGRTRDVTRDIVDDETLQDLDARGRPTLLFAPDGRPLDRFPAPVRERIERGVALGLPGRALIGQRRPWYRMESREPPPFLFAYLGRRNARFIRNSAGVVPLTGFLCVYPRRRDPAFLSRLWEVLQSDRTVSQLVRVGKSYGSGAVKVEPRALEALPLPTDVVRAAGLDRYVSAVSGSLFP